MLFAEEPKSPMCLCRHLYAMVCLITHKERSRRGSIHSCTGKSKFHYKIEIETSAI